MPCLVRVTSANSQLSQFHKRSYLPFRPFFTLQWALGSSQVWLQPLDSFTPIRIVARHCQVPHPELPPRSQESRSLLLEALSSSFPTKSALSLTALLQATGPVLQEVRLPASVWFLTLPCVFFTRLPPPRLNLCPAPRSLRPASSEQSTYTVPFCTSSPVLASSNLPCSGRLPVWRNRTLFRDCEVTRLQVHHKGFPNRAFRRLACRFQTPEVQLRGGFSELPRSPFPLTIPLVGFSLSPVFASEALRVLDDASEEDHEGPYPTSIPSTVTRRG